MMKYRYATALFWIPTFITGCSSLKTKNAIFKDIAIGAAIGVLVAQSETESKMAYTQMYGGIGAAAGGVTSVLLNVPNKLNYCAYTTTNWGACSLKPVSKKTSIGAQ